MSEANAYVRNGKADTKEAADVEKIAGLLGDLLPREVVRMLDRNMLLYVASKLVLLGAEMRS